MKLAWLKTLSYLYVGTGRTKTALLELFSLRLARLYLGSAGVLNLIVWFSAYRTFRVIGDNLAVLHYNVIFGIDLIGSPRRLYLMPLAGLAAIILNACLVAGLGGKRDRLLVHLLLGSAIVINALILIASYFVYLVNFS